MMLTHSLFNAALARLPSPAVYISAFAVAKSVVNLLKSPITMIRQTVSSLVTDKDSYDKVKNFFIIFTSLTILFIAFIALSNLSYWIFKNIMGITGETLQKAIIILKVLIIFPFAESMRNVIQGMAIKYDKTYLFTIATIFRIFYVFLVIKFIDQIMILIPGAVLAGLLLFGALLIEGIVLLIGVKFTIGNIRENINYIVNNDIDYSQTNLNYKMILLFFYPLSITTVLKFLNNPIINMGLARTSRPEIALSAYAVGWGLGLIFMSPLFMFHQVPINFMGYNGQNNFNSIKKFGIILAAIMTIIFTVVSFSKIGMYILTDLIGATEEIARLSLDVLKIMIVYPFIRLGREIYWGFLMKKQETNYISKARLIGIITLVSSVIFLSWFRLPNPAIVGVVSIILSHAVEGLYLYKVIHKNKILISEGVEL
ncbi:MAG: hypothetical protein ACOC4G_03565 [Bacillota bacterium]